MPFFHVFAIAVVPCGQKNTVIHRCCTLLKKDSCMAEAASVFEIDPIFAFEIDSIFVFQNDPIFVFQNDPPPALSGAGLQMVALFYWEM